MPIDLLFNGCLGVAFALCARDRVRADGLFAAPAFPLVAIFIAIVLTPIALYLYLAHPAWSWMYLVDPGEVPGLAIVPLLVLHGGAAVAGWYLGARLVRTGREKQARIGLLAGAVVVLAIAAIGWGRIGHYGSYRDFHGGRAMALFDVKLGYVLVGLALGISAAAGYVALELVRDSRRVRTR
jgi:hypothetical protein